jgi:C-terminal processing protease CtpA/Prc
VHKARSSVVVKKRTVSYAKINQTPPGPAFPPGALERAGDVYYGKTESGFGYLHVRRCKGELPQQVDTALAAIGAVPGVIVDFRGNSGGGFDHRELFGRFLPKGTEWRVGSGYESAGPNPFGGPMVVIVDATVRSAGETGSGQFLEDGRAFGIGESATAGMSSQKTTIALPSGLFAQSTAAARDAQPSRRRWSACAPKQPRWRCRRAEPRTRARSRRR